MRTACWINKAAERLIIFSIVCEIRHKRSIRGVGENESEVTEKVLQLKP